MEKRQDFTELLDDAVELLSDQPRDIQNLILWACKLDDEERAALIFAYRILHNEDQNG